jgi:hypothetical protein
MFSSKYASVPQLSSLGGSFPAKAGAGLQNPLPGTPLPFHGEGLAPEMASFDDKVAVSLAQGPGGRPLSLTAAGAADEAIQSWDRPLYTGHLCPEDTHDGAHFRTKIIL